jgi:hypothetical protein
MSRPRFLADQDFNEHIIQGFGGSSRQSNFYEYEMLG